MNDSDTNAIPQAGNEPTQPTTPPADPAQQPQTPPQPTAPSTEGTPPDAQAPADTTPPAQPFLTVRYNHRPKDLTADEAKELAQKGLGYDKAVERARQEAVDAYVASQNFVWDNKPIKTQADLNRAMYEKSLVDKGIPLEEIRRGLSSHPDVIRSQEILERNKSNEAEEARNKDMGDFLEWFETENGRPFDGKTDIVPAEVWEANKQGVPLRIAYAALHQTKALRDRIAELQKQQEKHKANEQNAAAATGSATGDGGAGSQPEFLTKEQVKAMSPAEVEKNRDLIFKSMPKW